jgi:putative membrane protein
MALLSKDALTRIEQTVAEIEQRTAAELVVVSVGQSASYAEIKLGYALALALLAGASGHLLWPDAQVVALLWLQLAAAALALLGLSVPAILRLCMAAPLLQHSVDQRARLAFAEHAVFDTRDRSGVLLLISELERRVVILGDTGIHQRVQVEGWQAHVDRIVTAIRAGRAEQGICDTLRAVGEILIAEFPVRPDDVNELPNAVRQTPR